jgi:hypothetical protein
MAPFIACPLRFRLVVVDPGFISSNCALQEAVIFYLISSPKLWQASFLQFGSHFCRHPPSGHLAELQLVVDDTVSVQHGARWFSLISFKFSNYQGFHFD